MRCLKAVALVTLFLTLTVDHSKCDDSVSSSPVTAPAETDSETSPTSTLSSDGDGQATIEDVTLTAVTPSPPVVEDENTKIARELFRAASAMLNSSSPDRHLAWETMERSADLGNVDAKVRIAFAKLAGVYFEQV